MELLCREMIQEIYQKLDRRSAHLLRESCKYLYDIPLERFPIPITLYDWFELYLSKEIIEFCKYTSDQYDIMFEIALFKNKFDLAAILQRKVSTREGWVQYISFIGNISACDWLKTHKFPVSFFI